MYFLVEAGLNDGKDQSVHEARNVGRYRGRNEKTSIVQALICLGRIFYGLDTIVENTMLARKEAKGAEKHH
jgi:hypothetical protein